MRSCESCECGKVTGKYYPQTRETPEEFPDVECGYDGEQNIQLFFDLLDVAFPDRWEEPIAKYCPFFKDNGRD